MKLPPELLTDLLARPDEPDGYLVAADWLSSHGAPWGELITAQESLERENEPSRFLALRRRAEALIAEHSRAWLGADVVATWRWGFVERLELNELSALPAVLTSDVGGLTRELVLRGAPLSVAKAVQSLGSPPRLDSLCLRGSTGVGGRRGAASKREEISLDLVLPRLPRIEVHGLALRWHGPTRHLRALSIADAPTPSLPPWLHTLPSTLERLELLDLNLPADCVQPLVDRQEALSALHLEDDLPDDLAAWLCQSPALKTLKHLALGGPMTDLGLDALLKNFARFARLDTLVLYGGRHGSSLRKLAYKQLPRLRFETRRPRPGWSGGSRAPALRAP